MIDGNSQKIYGFQEEEHKDKTGLLLRQLKEDQHEPWLCGGDFNLMLMSSEKKGGNEFRTEEAEILRQATRFCHLEDLGYVGHDFTWTNNRGGEQNIQERLDRFFATPVWRQAFAGSFVTHLSKRKSDHLPILLCLKGNLDVPKKKRKFRLFRFEAMWLRDESCAEIIGYAWENAGDLCSKIAHTSRHLSAWGRNKFGDIMAEIESCRNKMEQLMGDIQSA